MQDDDINRSSHISSHNFIKTQSNTSNVENSTASSTPSMNGHGDLASTKIDNSASFDTRSISDEQSFNEALIKLLVLLYQIDGKVTLTEQDLFDEIISTLTWHSGVSISAFVNDAIHQARVAIDQRESREFLFKLATGLNFNPAQVLEYAMDITEIDGKRSEEEVELLALLSNRVLARGLVDD